MTTATTTKTKAAREKADARKYGDITYKRLSWAPFRMKSDADRKARELRAQGYLARTAKDEDEFVVWFAAHEWDENTRWKIDVSKGLYDTAPLNDVLSRDGIAVECARRIRAFALDNSSYPYARHDYHGAREKALNPDGCFLLISWGGAVRGWKEGKLYDPAARYSRENRTVWAACKPDYYDNCVAPLVHRFTTDQLQATF